MWKEVLFTHFLITRVEFPLLSGESAIDSVGDAVTGLLDDLGSIFT